MQWNIKKFAIVLGGLLLLTSLLIASFTYFERNTGPQRIRLHTAESAKSTHSSRPKRLRPTDKDSISHLESDLPSEWSRIAQLTLNSKEKSKQFRELIDRECEIGRHTEVLEQLISSIGPGSDRNILLAIFFANDHIPLDATASLLERLDFEQEKSVAARALSSRLSRQSLTSIPSSLFHSDSPALRKSLIEGIEKFARSSAAVPSYKERLEQTLNTMPSIAPDQRKNAFSEAIATSASANNPFETWKFLQENRALLNELISSDALERVMGSMIQKDPAAALEGALYQQDPKLTEFALQYYLRKDSSAAAIWFQSNSQNLSELQISLFHKAASLRELTFGNTEYATEHAALIADNEIRKQVIDEIKKHEKK